MVPPVPDVRSVGQVGMLQRSAEVRLGIADSVHRRQSADVLRYVVELVTRLLPAPHLERTFFRQSLSVDPSDSRSHAAGSTMGRSGGTAWVVSEHLAKVPPASLSAAMVGSA